MSRSQFPALNAVASQIIAMLERYEQDVRLLVRGWADGGDTDLYLHVSRCMDKLRDLCASHPALGAQWVTLLISHTELMHALWRLSQRAPQPLLSEHLADHCDCIRALRSKCRRMLAQDAAQGAGEE